MIKAAVFDLDHTLFDRYATLTALMPKFFDEFEMGQDITLQEATELLIYADKNFVHLGWDKVLEYLTEKGMFKTKPSIEYYTEFLLSLFRTTAIKFPFTNPMLRELRARGIKTGLITNGLGKTQRAKLAMLELEPLLDEILISGEFGEAKPSPAVFLEMARRLNIEPGEMIYVGDHPKFDVDGSRAAGCVPVWVKTTGTWVYPEIEKPALQINDVSEIPALIEKLR